MTTEEAQKILEDQVNYMIRQDENLRKAGINPEKLACFKEDQDFIKAVRKIIKELNEEKKKNAALRKQRNDARKSVQGACENALEYYDKWIIAANTIDRAKKHIEEDMAHNNQFNCGDLQLILDILEDEE